MTKKIRLHEMGPGGFCICPKCEARYPHPRSVRCQDRVCPKCGVKMLREGSRDYQLWLEKKQDQP
jgi:uncharacterized paraquat-inducible protein A